MLLVVNTGLGLAILMIIGAALLVRWGLMDDTSIQEQWLIDNKVKYYKGKEGSSKGLISVDYNDIPDDLVQEYNDLMYKNRKL